MRTMKNSGVEWIGEIPSDWEVIRLRFLCDIQTGNMDTQNNNPEGKYPFYVRSPIIEYSDDFTFDNEAVLMAGDGVGAGKVFHYVSGKYGCHQRVYSISDFKGVKGKFIYYYLSENFYKKIEENNAKSTVDSVRMPMLKDFPVVLPIYETQQRIADFLDKKCGKIDEIIEREQIVIEKLKEYKQSVITEAVTKGLNPHAEMKDSGIGWIGKIPKDWKVTKIKYVSNFNPSNEKTLLPSDEIGYVPMECLKNGYMLPKVIEYSKTNSGLTYFETADIIMAKVTPCFENGNIAIAQNLKNNCAFGSSELFVFRSGYIVKEFLFYFLQNKKFKAMCIATMTGTGGLKRVSFDFIKNYKFALPNQIEQQQIADYLDNKCAKIDKTIEVKQSVIDKLTEYKKSLIYEVVTGKKEI